MNQRRAVERVMSGTEDTVLVVDDEDSALSALQRLFRPDGYRVLVARGAEEGLRALQHNAVGLVIADYKMPGMTGIQFLSQVRERWPNTVRVMLTGHADLDAAMEAINRGQVYRFVTKPWDAGELRLVARQGLDRYRRLLENRRAHALIQERNDSLQRTVERCTVEVRHKTAELQELHEQLKSNFLGTVEAMATIVEMHDPYTAGHQRRVSALARAIALEMGLAENEVYGIRIAAAVHDLGKIAVPAEILNRPGRISELEFNLIKSHPKVAYDILSPIRLPWPVAQMVVQHHERMDGSGYPAGMSGSGILLGARIIAVADAVEAMASHRPYRAALPMSAVIEEICRQRGACYDPEAVDACMRVLSGGACSGW